MAATTSSGAESLFSDTPALLVGGAGNDTIRVEDAQFTLIAGANQDGSGGAGETNTLEVLGSFFGADDDHQHQ